MSIRPRNSNNNQDSPDNALGIAKREANIDIVSRDVDKSIAELNKKFNRLYEKQLSTVESNISKHMANAEVRLTRNGNAISDGYKEYLAKINSINDDLLNAKSKSEVKEINNTIKTYKKIVKSTKLLSRDEKRELTNIVKETTNASKIVRNSKLSNPKLFMDAIKNNLPDIAGITSSIFGDSIVPAFIGGAIGDYLRTKKEVKSQEKSKQQQLLKDERDYNIRKSVELRQNRGYNALDINSLRIEKEKGFFGKRLNRTPSIVKKSLAIKRNAGIGMLSRIPDSMTKKTNNLKRLTGRELSTRIINENRVNSKIKPMPIDIKSVDSKKGNVGRPLGSKNKVKGGNNLIKENTISPVDIKESVFDGVYDSMKKLSEEGIFTEDNKETKFKRNIEKFESKSKENKKRLDDKLKRKTDQDIAQQQIRILQKSAEDTENLLKIENKRRIITLISFLADYRKDVGSMINTPFKLLSSKFDIFKKMKFDKIGEFFKKNVDTFFNNPLIKTGLGFFENTETARHKELITTIKDSSPSSPELISGITSIDWYSRQIYWALKNISDAFKTGITTIPFDYGIITPVDDQIIQKLTGIEDENRIEAELLDSFVNCFPCDKDTVDAKTGKLVDCTDCTQNVEDRKLINIMDDVRAGLGLSWQDSKEQGINNEEKISDKIKRQDKLQTSLDDIYNVLDERLNNPTTSTKSKKGMFGGILGGLTNGLFGSNNDFPTVNLSKSTIKALGKAMDDDGILDMMPKSLKKKMKGSLKKIPSKLGGLLPTLSGITGGLGMSGLLTSSGSAIAGAGAGAIATSAGLAGMAGVAGYGVGSLINKGLDSGIEKITGGKNKSLGGWIYDVLHPSSARQMMRTQDISQMKEDIADMKNQTSMNNISNAVNSSNTVVGGSTTNITMPVSPHDTDRGTDLLVHSYGS